MGQLQANFESVTRVVGGAMCMFRVRKAPKITIMKEVEGLISTVEAECCVCKKNVILQKSGAPQSVLPMTRMHINDLALANVILQSNGSQPLEVMQLHVITSDQEMHQKLHKFEASQYQKFATGSESIEVTNTPSKEVQDLFSTPRQAKRLKIQHTLDIEDRMCKSEPSNIPE